MGYGMEISKNKTEVMMLSRIPSDINITLNGDLLQQSRDFIYLGVMFCQDSDSQVEIMYRIQKFNDNFCKLHPSLKDRNIPQDVKKIK